MFLSTLNVDAANPQRQVVMVGKNKSKVNFAELLVVDVASVP